MPSALATPRRDPSRSQTRECDAGRVWRSLSHGLGLGHRDAGVSQIGDDHANDEHGRHAGVHVARNGRRSGGKVGPQSDVYLLGAILFEILTGQPPHSGKTVMKCLMAAARNEIVSTQHSGELMDIALRAMASKMSDRPQSVRDFQNAIREYQAHSESLALLQRAEDRLQAARVSKDYEELSRAVFEYDEAVELWEGNERAKQGGLSARLTYAEIARERNDLELADSILLADEPSHAALKDKLQHEIAEEKLAAVACAPHAASWPRWPRSSQ